MPPGAVHAAFAGYMLSNAGVPSRAIVRAVGGKAVPTLDALQAPYPYPYPYPCPCPYP